MRGVIRGLKRNISVWQVVEAVKQFIAENNISSEGVGEEETHGCLERSETVEVDENGRDGGNDGGAIKA